MKEKIFDVFGVIILSIAVLFSACEPEPVDPDLLNPKLKEPSVYLFPAEEIDLNSAKLSAIVKSGRLDSEAWFEYKAKGDSKYLTTEITDFWEDSIKVTLHISDLKADTEYYFKVVAKNKKGQAYEELSFRTPVEIVTDASGNKYKAIRYGSQIWLDRNLKTTKLANGEGVWMRWGSEFTYEKWMKDEFASVLFFSNPLDSMMMDYGGHYCNYGVYKNEREFIKGYKIPSVQDFEILKNTAGNDENTLARLIKGNKQDQRAKGVKKELLNSSGFSAVGAGYFYFRRFDQLAFSGMATETEMNPFDAFITSEPRVTHGDFYNFYVTVYYIGRDSIGRMESPEASGTSIRLIKK